MQHTLRSVDLFIDAHGIRIGRILIGLLFLVTGIGSLMGFSGFVAYTGSVLPMPTLFAVLAIICKVGGGLSLVLGIRVRIGTAALILFTFLAMIFFHLKPMFAGDQMQMIMVLKNLAIIGGLILIARFSAPIQTPVHEEKA
jgi:putative oxidoreductase